MLEKVSYYERDLFFLLNGSDCVALDRFIWLCTGKTVWLPLAAVILGVLIYKSAGAAACAYSRRLRSVFFFIDQTRLWTPASGSSSRFYGIRKNRIRIQGRTFRFHIKPCGKYFRLCNVYVIVFQENSVFMDCFLWAAFTAYLRAYIWAFILFRI